VVEPIGLYRTVEVGPETAQRGDLVLVLPQALQGFVVRVERRAKRFDGQSENPLGRGEAMARRQRDVGRERRGAGRAVHDRHPLPLLEVAFDRARQWRERHDLARPNLPTEREGGQRPVEQRRDPLRDHRPRLGVSLDEVCETREDDSAHDALLEDAAAAEGRAPVAAEGAGEVPLLLGGE
jgi:hypothetical protein